MATINYSDMPRPSDSDYDADASSSALGSDSTSPSRDIGTGKGPGSGSGTGTSTGTETFPSASPGTGCSGLAFVRWICACLLKACQLLYLVGVLFIAAISTLTEVCFSLVIALLMDSDCEITIAIKRNATLSLRIRVCRQCRLLGKP